MTEWWLIRHGPTHAARMVGHTDLPADLSDSAALARLAGLLPAEAEVLSSDLQRARMTARALGLVPTADPRLREFNYGAWENLPFDAPEVDQDLARAFWEKPGEIRPPGGESWNDVSARVSEVLRGQRTRHVIAVAHMGVIMVALAHATGMAPRAALSFRIEPLSLTRLTDHGAGGWSVERVNHVP